MLGLRKRGSHMFRRQESYSTCTLVPAGQRMQGSRQHLAALQVGLGPVAQLVGLHEAIDALQAAAARDVLHLAEAQLPLHVRLIRCRVANVSWQRVGCVPGAASAVLGERCASWEITCACLALAVAALRSYGRLVVPCIERKPSKMKLDPAAHANAQHMEREWRLACRARCFQPRGAKQAWEPSLGHTR